MKTPILGSSYVARSVNAADNRMVNLFSEIVPEGGKDPAFLSRTPGLRYVTNIGSGPIRGMWTVGVLVYVVSGAEFYVWNPDTQVQTLKGAVSGTTEPVSMSDNGLQVFVSCNNSPTYDAYVYTIATTTLTHVVDPDFPGSGKVCFLNGYFVINKPNSQRVYVSSLYDGLTWTATDFASAEASPDNVVGVIAAHGELWVFGENTTEVWYNAGNAGFPFAPIQGAFSEIGCMASNSIAKVDNTLFWLGRNVAGQGIVYKNNGYIAQRVSTHAVEWQIQNSSLDPSAAVSYTYQQDGHVFYLMTVSSELTTWCYDVTTESWHERQSNNSSGNARHWGNCQTTVKFPGSFYNLIGDYNNPNIYKFDLTIGIDQSTAITSSTMKWIRSWRALPMGQNNLKRTAQHSLQLDIETGDGTGNTVVLRWSDDGGHTWSSNHTVSMGGSGDYGTRVIWRRLGMTMKLRDRVYEISSTTGGKTIIMGAELVMSPTDA